MNLRERAGLVDTVGSALSRGEHTLSVLPGLIRQLLEEEAWREFETKMGKHITYDRFEDFVVTPPLSGLGTSIDLVRRVTSDDLVTSDLLDRTLQHSTGNPIDADETQGRSEVKQSTSTLENIEKGKNKEKEPSDRLLRRLHKDFPDLYTQVLNQEKSVHAAAIEAKISPPRIAINLANPQSAATTLLTNASPEFLEELKKLLEQK